MCVSPNSRCRDAAGMWAVRSTTNNESRRARLRPLVSVIGVLDGEIVEPELLLHLLEHFALGFVEVEPDELILHRAPAGSGRCPGRRLRDPQ